MAANDPHVKIKDELYRIEEDCIHSGKSQFNAGDRWAFYHYCLGIPSVVLSSIAGAAFLKDYPELAGAMSIIVTVLTALMTFLKPSERASSHKSSGDQYLALRNDARIFREIKLDQACDAQAAIDGLDEFTKRRNELNKSSMPPARRDFIKARKGIDSGEALHAVDKKDK
ncbi:SLATT domain-containing protein [Asticcacaulis sp. AND118]|uniref:SLATT domain-containing protein n=1 Tax=Asticcacaulis sp. AND118 TaxID=2840468 RepID=UPI001CFFED66|nr:SLATT domain-containing protein [Asticcacaulis sp. AND118]UDF03492.1 SLATT domain-containing protein [Asticcacaulis sp. AND118]